MVGRREGQVTGAVPQCSPDGWCVQMWTHVSPSCSGLGGTLESESRPTHSGKLLTDISERRFSHPLRILLGI